ncbi:MAG: hypothetical protein ABI472_14885 [Ginsengibacter sp.]
MKILLLFLSGLFWITASLSQGNKVDSLADIQVKNVISLYDHYTDGNAPVYNGSEYLYYTFKTKGDPFFEWDNLSKGWLSYEGKVFDPLSILYDIARNQVVVLLPDSTSRAVVQNEFIDSFEISNHTFINLKEDHRQNLYNTGFYDLLYRGHMELMARRVKEMTEVIEDNAVIRVFSPKDNFYIHKGGRYYLVNNEKDVFRLFADKKHEIRKMLRREHLKFRRKNFESILLKVTAFYDQSIQ